MKIRRYLARDMRSALNQVREAQGAEAVIVSTRRLGDSVEVVAAIDFDIEAERVASDNLSNELRGYGFLDSDEDAHSHNARDSDRVGGVEASSFESHLQAANSAHSANAANEINALRRMLETQLAALAWNDLSRRAPIHTEVLRELSRLGIAADLASELIAHLPERSDLQAAIRIALALWSNRIPVCSERWMNTGGTLALVGPTGVGKTSTLAKLAAKWVIQNGPRDLALISADCMRIGAQDQMQSIGRLLGVPAINIDSISELPAALSEWEHRRFVLVDTPGASPRDPLVAAELATLSVASDRMETTLVLSASSQSGAIEESLYRFQAAQPKTCVLTKLDEAVSLGGALSALIRAELPVAYLCEGQRLAEDIRPARSHHLVARAVQLARTNGAASDEDLLTRRFGGIAHALA